MKRCTFYLLIAIVTTAAHAAPLVLNVDQEVAQAVEKPGPLWPCAPIAISPVEGVIESFWIPALKATTRWKGENGVLTATGDACHFKIEDESSGTASRISRNYQLQLVDYQRLRIRIRPGKAVRTTIVATVDGCEQTIVEDAVGSDDAFELSGQICGRNLTQLTLEFKVDTPGTYNVQLRWILLEKDGISWNPPKEPFKGMIVEAPVSRFEPGLGLLMGSEQIQQMRDMVKSPEFEDVWKADLEFAERQYLVNPASQIRPYSLYVPSRYGRDTDTQYETGHDGVILALVGLLAHNEDYLRQAARHAISLAHIDNWSEGFVDRMPGYPWHHSYFAPNTATIRASLLLDWTWHYLTPEGRQLIRDAIARKGLPYVEMGKGMVSNQGVRFNKGVILGRMALDDSFNDPELKMYVQDCIDQINSILDKVVRPEGTFSEGMGYGKGTMASTLISYQAASRCLDAPIVELVSPRMLPSMHYILEADRRISACMAAFCAGPLGDKTFISQCVPTRLLQLYSDQDLFAEKKYSFSQIEYSFFGLVPLWAPVIHKSQQPPSLSPFSVYRTGGWVFGGNDNPAQPRFSFESGLWDGIGHAWFHKNAVTLDGWGERLLISRFHLGYQDSRSNYTMSTKLYNTFAPSGRNQNASGTPGRGAELRQAEDLGSIVVVESDNATAWQSGVNRNTRRMLFVRPNVMIIHDDAEFLKAEPGVQSWNSFQPWHRIDDYTCESSVGKAAVRLTAVTSGHIRLTSEQCSVSREGLIEVPVYRAAFTTDSMKSHDVLTVIEAIGPDESKHPTVVIHETGHVIEVRSAGRVVQVISARGNSTIDPLAGFESDGRLLFIVREDDKVTQAGTFGATWLQTPDGLIKGQGFLLWKSHFQRYGE